MTIAENLLRLYRWQLDERRRYLTELESLAERLRVEVRRLTAEIDPAQACRITLARAMTPVLLSAGG